MVSSLINILVVISFKNFPDSPNFDTKVYKLSFFIIVHKFRSLFYIFFLFYNHYQIGIKTRKLSSSSFVDGDIHFILNGFRSEFGFVKFIFEFINGLFEFTDEFFSSFCSLFSICESCIK